MQGSEEGERKRSREDVQESLLESIPISDALKQCRPGISDEKLQKYLNIMSGVFEINNVGEWAIQEKMDKDAMTAAGLPRVVIQALDAWLTRQPGRPEASSNTVVKCADAGQWPTLHKPPGDATGDPPTTVLQFVNTVDGPWCFEQGEAERMIRLKEYVMLWDRLKAILRNCTRTEGRKGLLIKGHPGIGKTLLLDLILSWLLHDFPGLPVLVIAVDGVTIFVNTPIGGGKKRYVVDHKQAGVRGYTDLLLGFGVAKGSQIAILHDIKTQMSLPFQAGIVESLSNAFAVMCVVSSSPKGANFKDFVKWMHPPATYALQTLSVDEAREFATKYLAPLPAAEFDEIFDAVGGVPRHLVSRAALEEAKKQQKVAVKTLHFDPGCEAEGATDKDTNAIVCPVPRSDRTEIEFYDFVSALARRVWLESASKSTISRQLQRLRDAKDEQTRDVLGRVFEYWFLLQLQGEGGPSPLCWKRLNPAVNVPPPHLEQWPLPTEKLVVTRFPGDDAAVVQPAVKPTLFIPTSSRFPVADALLVVGSEATLIQVTVAGAHKPNLKPTVALLARLKENKLRVTSLVWVVDLSSTLASAQSIVNASPPATKDFDDIPQYLVRVDEFMCWVGRESSDGKGKAVSGTVLGFPVPTATPTTTMIETQVQRWIEVEGTVTLRNFKHGDLGTLACPLLYNCVY